MFRQAREIREDFEGDVGFRPDVMGLGDEGECVWADQGALFALG